MQNKGGAEGRPELIVGKYEGTIYPEAQRAHGAIDIGTGADRQALKRKAGRRRSLRTAKEGRGRA